MPQQDWFAAQEAQGASDWFSAQEQQQAPEHPHARLARIVQDIVTLGGGKPMPEGQRRFIEESNKTLAAKNPIQEGIEQGIGAAVGVPAGNLISAGTRAVGKAVGDRAVPLVRSALKPVWATVRKRANVEGVMPSAVANSQARFIVEKQLRTPEQADALVKSLGQRIDDSNAASSTPLDLQERVPRYLNTLLKRAKGQVLPRADRVAIENTAREVLEESPISRTVVQNVEKEVPSQILDDSGRPFTKTVVEEIKKREIRPDVLPSEGMQIARDTSAMSTGKSWGTDPGSVGAKAGEKTLERAVRDGVKAANPAVRPLLKEQGRAMDARQLLDRALWRDANRDAIGLGGIAGLANGRPTIGAILQLIKEKQLEAGLAAGRWGPRITRNAQPTGDQLQMALRALLAGASTPTAPPE